MPQSVKVTATEFQKAFGALSDKALEQPVTITRKGRDHLVVLSATEYARLKLRDRQVGLTADLPDEWAEAVEKAEVPQEFNYLNELLDP